MPLLYTLGLSSFSLHIVLIVVPLVYYELSLFWGRWRANTVIWMISTNMATTRRRA